MARAKRTFVCRECGEQTAGWAGRCPGCDAWATVEEVDLAEVAAAISLADDAVQRLADVDSGPSIPSPTGVDEIDRVLGGGLTPGSATLLGGEPGVGKSTLMLQLALAVAGSGASVLVMAGEEAPGQIARRAARLGAVPSSLSVTEDTSVDALIAAVDRVRPQVAIIDSIQMVSVDGVDSAPGSVAQLKLVTDRLVSAAKRFAVSIVMVGHVTKDGALAGPRAIEHLVDTVLSFSGDRSGELRSLRAIKHRFGPTSEVGFFEMTGGGLKAVADASGRFLTDRQPGLAGSVVTASVDGRRPILVEVQALTVHIGGTFSGRPTVRGVDGRRLAMVAAVMQRRAGIRLSDHEIFVSSVGGADVVEPGADLGLAIALASSVADYSVRPDLVACGEIGLGGELRSVPLIEHRLQEAFRLGFRTAVVPLSAPDGPLGMTMIKTATVDEALGYATRPMAA